MATKKKKRRASDCKRKDNNGERCLGRYRLEYEDRAPLFVCDVCNDRELTWKKFYLEYMSLWTNPENWEIDKHKISCIIGAFCYSYKKKFGADYVFVPSNPNPYSSKEIRDAWKLLATFKNNAVSVRLYIVWVFKHIIKPGANVVSFAYITAPGIIRQYNLHLQKKQQITRGTDLPPAFLSWCRNNIPEIFDNYEMCTVNDLGALLQQVEFYGLDGIEFRAIKQAEQYNLIKDGKLNIKESL